MAINLDLSNAQNAQAILREQREQREESSEVTDSEAEPSQLLSQLNASIEKIKNDSDEFLSEHGLSIEDVGLFVEDPNSNEKVDIINTNLVDISDEMKSIILNGNAVSYDNFFNKRTGEKLLVSQEAQAQEAKTQKAKTQEAQAQEAQTQTQNSNKTVDLALNGFLSAVGSTIIAGLNLAEAGAKATVKYITALTDNINTVNDIKKIKLQSSEESLADSYISRYENAKNEVNEKIDLIVNNPDNSLHQDLNDMLASKTNVKKERILYKIKNNNYASNDILMMDGIKKNVDLADTLYKKAVNINTDNEDNLKKLKASYKDLLDNIIKYDDVIFDMKGEKFNFFSKITDFLKNHFSSEPQSEPESKSRPRLS